jgi:hypothetical protein
MLASSSLGQLGDENSLAIKQWPVKSDLCLVFATHVRARPSWFRLDDHGGAARGRREGTSKLIYRYSNACMGRYSIAGPNAEDLLKFVFEFQFRSLDLPNYKIQIKRSLPNSN